MTIRAFYDSVGGSYDDVMGRLSSEALVLKFLRMLPRDGNMALLDAAMDSADAPSAFRAACEHLLARGAEVLVLGCTELPPAFELYRLDYPNIDPTLELALGAIRAAGCEVK